MIGGFRTLVVSPAAWFYDGNALFTHRAFFRLIGYNVQLEHGKMLRIEGDLSVAAVNDVTHARQFGVCLFDQIYDFKYGPSCGYYVLNDENPLSRMNFKPPAKFHLPILPLAKHRADTEHSSHFRADNDPADGGRYNDFDIRVLKMLRNFAGEEVQILRVLNHPGALKVLRAVKAGSELKMPFKEGLCLSKDIENLLFWEFHGGKMN